MKAGDVKDLGGRSMKNRIIAAVLALGMVMAEAQPRYPSGRAIAPPR